MTRPLQQVKFGALAALMVASTVSSLVNTTAVSAVVDCTNDAVIRCGVTYTTQRQSREQMRNDMQTNDGLYSISQAARKYLREHEGEVNIAEGQLSANGVITVGGEVVAKSTETYGRENRDGRREVTQNGARYYAAPAANFVDAGKNEMVYVMLTTNGEFISAVMRACGNPVKAVAVKEPTAPTPEAPKPAPEAPIVPVIPVVAAPVAAPAPVAPQETPVVETPQVIASTGIADGIMSKGVGLGTLTALLGYAVNARRRLF